MPLRLAWTNPKRNKYSSLLEPAPEIDPIPALNLPQYIADVEQQSNRLLEFPLE